MTHVNVRRFILAQFIVIKLINNKMQTKTFAIDFRQKRQKVYV